VAAFASSQSELFPSLILALVIFLLFLIVAFIVRLQCIGLACLVVDDKAVELDEGRTILTNNFSEPTINIHEQCWHEANDSLVDFISKERRRNQLRALATCIGFNSESSPYGPRGDITPFMECLRLHVISNKLVQERLEMDPHERGSEEARWWGLLRPDSTSVIIKDARSNAYQLLTAGDPEVVTTLCHEAWQGENSTILPLAAADRATILETGRSWKLADLNVVAFSYTPIPHTFEKRLVPGYIPRVRCAIIVLIVIPDHSTQFVSLYDSATYLTTPTEELPRVPSR